MGVSVNNQCHGNVMRTRRTLGPSRRASLRLGATLLQASATVFPIELIIVAAVLGSIAAILLVVPFAALLALRFITPVVPLMLRDAEPAKRVSSWNF